MGQPCLRLQSVVWAPLATGRDLLVMFWIEQFLCWRRECHIICLWLTSHALLFDHYAEGLHSMWLTVIFQHTLMRPVSWLLKLTIQDSGRVLGRSTERAAAVEKGHCMFHGFTFCKRRRF